MAAVAAVRVLRVLVGMGCIVQSRKRNIPDSVRWEYLEWLLTPPSERVPSTKTAMAEQLGVERKTLYNWEESEDFQVKLREVKQKWGVRFESDILSRLISVVDGGSDRDAIAAAKVLLGHIAVKDEGKSASGISDAQRAAIREELRAAGFEDIK